MATFNMGKDAGDIEQPELLPEDWYPFVISAEPEQLPNAKKKADPNAEGAGDNIVIKLSCLSDDPRFASRPMTVWLPLPAPGDSEARTPMGQTKEDSKVERITAWAEAFSGSVVEGSEVGLSAGMKAMCYVTQGLDQAKVNLVNSFGFTNPKPMGGDVDGVDAIEI